MPGFINLHQYHVEEQLLLALERQPNVEIRRGHEVTGVTQNRGWIDRSLLECRTLAGLLESVGQLRAIGRNHCPCCKSRESSFRFQSEDLRAILKACDSLREHVRNVVTSNLEACETGYPKTTRQRSG
jgi:hypothetical protein